MRNKCDILSLNIDETVRSVIRMYVERRARTIEHIQNLTPSITVAYESDRVMEGANATRCDEHYHNTS